MRQLQRLAVLCLSVMLFGCAQPKVEHVALLQYPTSKVQNLYIDISGADSSLGSWGRVVKPDFVASTPTIYAKYGVNAKVIDLINEINTIAPAEGDYILTIKFKNGYSGSSGSFSNYSLDLINSLIGWPSKSVTR